MVRQFGEDLCAEVAKLEAQMPDKSTSVQFYQRAVTALANQHGQAVDFPPAPWNTLPSVQAKLRGQIGCSERMFSRQGAIGLGILVFVWAVFSLLFHLLTWTLGMEHGYQQYGAAHRWEYGAIFQDALPSTYEWDVSGLGNGQHLSPLFDRRGVPGMQLKLTCDASSGCSLALLAPDGWKVHFELHAGRASKKLYGVFPINGTNTPLGVDNLSAPGTFSYNMVSVQVTHAIQKPVAMKPHRTFVWDISTTSLDGKQTSSNFALESLQGLSLQLYLSGDSSASLSNGDACAIYFCGPSGWSITYRLFIDSVARTMTHHFQNKDIFFSPACTGFPDFTFRKEGYSQAGLEILQMHNSN